MFVSLESIHPFIEKTKGEMIAALKRIAKDARTNATPRRAPAVQVRPGNNGRMKTKRKFLEREKKRARGDSIPDFLRFFFCLFCELFYFPSTTSSNHNEKGRRIGRENIPADDILNRRAPYDVRSSAHKEARYVSLSN